MIDNPEQVDRLMSRLEAALPLPARATPRLLATFRKGATTSGVTSACVVRALHYLGDEAGIVCDISPEAADQTEVLLASITDLLFDPRLHITREIAAY